MARNLGIFISHAWKYNADYYSVERRLIQRPYFGHALRNYSVPEHDPLIDPDHPVGRRKLESELERQMRPVSCVLVIAGMWVPRSHWIMKELDLASQMGKPVVGIYPWGQERAPRAVLERADVMCGWPTESIVSAIRQVTQ